MRALPSAAAWLLLTVFLLPAHHAAAYCRTRTDTRVSGACVESEAHALHWTRSCAAYAFHDRAFARIPGLDEGTVREIAAEAFYTWAQVDCGQSPFSVQQLAQTTNTKPLVFVKDRPNEFVLSVLTEEEWREEEMDPDAFAITYLWYEKESGQILDVDMALNLTQGPFGDCTRPCTDGTIDLGNTLTHEAGHVLGLGHSQVFGATMQPDASPGAVFMRTLELDDRLGVCALDLPAHECPDSASCLCPAPPIVYSSGSQPATRCAVLGPIDPQGTARGPIALCAAAALWFGGRVGRKRLRKRGTAKSPCR